MDDIVPASAPFVGFHFDIKFISDNGLGERGGEGKSRATGVLWVFNMCTYTRSGKGTDWVWILYEYNAFTWSPFFAIKGVLVVSKDGRECYAGLAYGAYGGINVLLILSDS